MQKSLEQLMEERHEAYQKAVTFSQGEKRVEFGNEALVLAWRAANRAYSLARVSDRQLDRAA